MKRTMSVLAATTLVGPVFFLGSASATQESAAVVKGKCLGQKVRVASTNARGVPKEAARKAHRIHDDAARCNKRSLVRMVTADDTLLGLGGFNPVPSTHFKIPQNSLRPYDQLVRILQTRPAKDRTTFNKTTYVWPAVAGDVGGNRKSAWDEVVAAGLMTRKAADEAYRKNEPYYGDRIFITTNGTWEAFVSGD